MTLAVLIPDPLGFHLFVRLPKDRFHRISDLVAPEDLTDVLRPLGDPILVALDGTRHAACIADQVGDFADLVVVPANWTRSVPRSDLFGRARLLARLASFHRASPLDCYYSARSDLPF